VSTEPSTWRIALAGAGHVGGGVLDILHDRGDALIAEHGVRLIVTGVAELGGGAIDPAGLDVAALRTALSAGRALGELPRVGILGLSPIEMLDRSDADILLEATPVDLTDGEPGLSTVRHALLTGRHAVLANKGPVALAYDELAALSRRPAPMLRFSATVAGALPVVTMGQRDMAGCRITRLEGVLNGTSHSILRAMERGDCFADAVLDAQRRGIAEADPSLDVDGHDAACKLAIAANAVLGMACTVKDVAVRGIRDLTADDVRAPLGSGQRLVLLCLAEADGNGYQLSVAPTPVPEEHPLARLHPDEMGVVFHTDRNTRISAASLEPGAEPASAAMLRDVLDIIRSTPCSPA
jgi:homoserine dehydrogenase